jgi:hypothetical protein
VTPALLTTVLLATVCPPGDLTAGRPVSLAGPASGPAARLVDNVIATEGSAWNGARSLVIAATATVVVDLGEPRELRYLALQADNDDSYPVELSSDGTTWRTIWWALPDPGRPGLRMRHVELTQPATGRFLRLRGASGDGNYALAELDAACVRPAVWPPRRIRDWGWHGLDNNVMVFLKGLLAALGGLLLLWEWWRRRRKDPLSAVERRRFDGALALLGLVALAAWWNFGRFHFNQYLHTWEHYHYYVGAKYFPELSYSRLYQCTAVAESELGFRAQVEKRKLRNLETNLLEDTHGILAAPERCTRHFTPARWDAFKRDIAFFRTQLSTSYWEKAQTDHGFNGTPVWMIGGRLLASTGPASPGQIFLLGLCDPLLLFVMWGVVVWAFGWRAAAVAALWWGTNIPARYWWIGGAYLRHDWLAAAVIGVCLLRKERHLWGGVLLTYAALLRIFPGGLAAGVVLSAAVALWRKKRETGRFTLAPAHRRFAVGCLAALLFLVPASTLVTSGGLSLSSWRAFAVNSKKHVRTPLTNYMGLRTVLTWSPSTRAARLKDQAALDPFGAWKAAKLRLFDQRWPVFALLLLAFVVLLGRAFSRDTEPWVAAVLGCGLIPVATELTCYYYSILLVYGLLWLEQRLVGVGLAALSLTTAISVGILWWDDECYALMSLLVLGFVAAVTACRRPPPSLDR